MMQRGCGTSDVSGKGCSCRVSAGRKQMKNMTGTGVGAGVALYLLGLALGRHDVPRTQQPAGECDSNGVRPSQATRTLLYTVALPLPGVTVKNRSCETRRAAGQQRVTKIVAGGNKKPTGTRGDLSATSCGHVGEQQHVRASE